MNHSWGEWGGGPHSGASLLSPQSKLHPQEEGKQQHISCPQGQGPFKLQLVSVGALPLGFSGQPCLLPKLFQLQIPGRMERADSWHHSAHTASRLHYWGPGLKLSQSHLEQSSGKYFQTLGSPGVSHGAEAPSSGKYHMRI